MAPNVHLSIDICQITFIRDFHFFGVRYLGFVETFAEAFLEALNLIVTGDQELLQIVVMSIYISGMAVVLASTWSLVIAILVGTRNFPGKRFVTGIFHAMMGIPTVTLGLFFYLILSRSGPLGYFGLLYRPEGIILGQAVLISPIIISFAISAIESVDPNLRNLARTLGASNYQTSLTIMRESSNQVLLSIVAGFNRAIAELGLAMMLGGNIRNVTRVLTTTIALETSRGEIALSIALAIILLIIVYSISLALSLLRRE